MSSHRNPFRSRTSEQQSYQGLRRFLKTFGVGAIDLLPENAWDRPALIQSAPGAGKTSLLRTFSAEALHQIATHPNELEELHQRMSELGVIDGQRVATLGVRLPLKRDYALIDDLPLGDDAKVKVFLRLLDTKLVRAIAEALSSLWPEAGEHALRWEPSAAGSDALEQLGGPRIADLLAWAQQAQRKLLGQLDSVLPPPPEALDGHHVSYAVQALNGASFTRGGEDLDLRPLLMFDDAQEVGRGRRARLLDLLADRELSLPRWVAERYESMTADEMIGDGEVDRGYVVVHIEAEARRLRLGGARRYSRNTRGFERLLLDISDRRAAQTLQIAAEEERDLSELLDGQIDETDERLPAIRDTLEQRLTEMADGSARYEQWVEWSMGRRAYAGAVDCRAVTILIARDKGRRQDTLFTVPLTVEDLRARWDSDLVEAASLFLREEHALPYYASPERLTKLASENIDQHIVIMGALFDEVLARITMNRSLAVGPIQQDRIVRRVSEQFWRDIPPRLPSGREIQQLLLNVAGLCRQHTYRPTAPYAPGATATAISMRDRQKLIDPHWRARVDGAEALYNAIASAVGHNLLRADLDSSFKNDRWMVLYLNRLLCVRFGLPLGYGGIRERRVEELCQWMVSERPDEGELLAPVLQERLAV